MYKQIKEPAFFGKKPQIVTAMFCDGCGKKLTWCAPHPSGKHYCEKCLKQQNEK